MREHKYRAWDKKTKQMVEVVAIVYSDFQIEAGCDDKLGDPEVDEGTWVKIANLIVVLRDFKDVELMQYTGLKDNNCKEIYEGDILHWDCLVFLSVKRGEVREDVYANVVWTQNGAGFTLQRIGANLLRTLDMQTSEIIGNIHENPELVEGVKTDV